jgi:hypothetical protein
MRRTVSVLIESLISLSANGCSRRPSYLYIEAVSIWAYAGEVEDFETLYGLIQKTFRTLAGMMGHLPLRIAAIAIFAGAAMSAQPVQAQNLVQDPGFEDSTDGATSPGWTLGMSGEGFTDFANNSDTARTGNWSATFGDASQQDATIDTLSQTIATVPQTTYLVSFYLADASPGDGKTFLATFDGQTVLSLTSTDMAGYVFYSASIVATSSDATLAFNGTNPPAQFYLDDISVEAQGAPAPVPGTGGLSLIAGAAMLAGAGWRRMRRKRAELG